MANIVMNNNKGNTIKSIVNGKKIFRMNLNLTEIIDLISSMNSKSQHTHKHYTQPHAHTYHYGHCYDLGQRKGRHSRGDDMGMTEECFL